MTQHGYQAGGYDWLAVWRRMYDEERAQAENAIVAGFDPPADCWAGQASRFAAAAERSEQPDGFMRFLLPRLRPADRIVDIGAGTGRYEPLLAGAAAEVLALEPSPAMRAQLERRLAEYAATNVRLIADRWPDADVPACDIAIAAHVLYGVREIEPFLRRMDAVATRGCYLLLAIRHPSAFASPFWQRIHGAPRLPLPGALECLSALHQIGIPAQLATVPVTTRISFADADEALADLRWRLRVPDRDDYNQRIRAAIDDLLDRADEGRLEPRDQLGYAAVIWWEKAEPAGEAIRRS